MPLDLIIRYFHFLSILAIASCLVSQHLLIAEELPRKAIRRLAVIDAIYGAAAILMVATGLLMWFAVGKPASFYSLNYIFHSKVTLAVVLGILSLWPTIFFNKQKKGDQEELVNLPSWMKMILRVELLIVFSLPLLASMMARGIGYFGS